MRPPAPWLSTRRPLARATARVSAPPPSPTPGSSGPRVTGATGRVRVLGPAGEPLHPCHPARARELVRRGRAAWVAGAPRTLRLLAPPGDPG